MTPIRKSDRLVAGVDVFCGIGGLTYGLRRAGIEMVAGVDSDPDCEFAFVQNNGALFIEADIRDVEPRDIAMLYPPKSIRVLAGCAPCRPFSSFRRGTTNSKDSEWGLLDQFTRLVVGLNPELVTMENVPDIASKRIFHRFLGTLLEAGYEVDYRSVYCPRLGIPQHRRRLVLVASRIGQVRVPDGTRSHDQFRTVREAIGCLPPLAAGDRDPTDRLHKARAHNELSLRRLKSSIPGGTWHDWPEELRSHCHRVRTGASYKSVYARMAWDEPSPTITTQAYNFGTGRFGHPDQDRSLSLREAALLQTFPRRYRFVPPSSPVYFSSVGRMIGNAVPPRLGALIGRELLRSVNGV